MVTLLALLGGMALGGWLKDRQWRAAATIGVRMASAGRFYMVMREDAGSGWRWVGMEAEAAVGEETPARGNSNGGRG
jgi:hypothetical protein